MRTTMTPASRRDTRIRILDAALDLFVEHGFAGATLQQIADRLGFTKAALYYHFKSKDDLLAALITPAMAELDALLARYEVAPDTPARRRDFMREYLDFLLANRRLIAYTVRDLPTLLAHPSLATGWTERGQRLSTILAGEDPDFDAQVRFTMVVRGFAAAIAQFPEVDADDLRDALMGSARSMLRSSPRPRTTPA